MSFESNNPATEPETLDIDLDPFQRAGILLLALAVIFSSIGFFVSPHDITGKPILLLPEVKQMEGYRRSSIQWIEEFHSQDRQMTTIAADQQGDLFSQSREAQIVLQLAVRLAQDVDRTAFPPSAVSLHEDMVSASIYYLEAARAMMIWVGAPEDSKRAQLDQTLALARQSLEILEKNKWLRTH